MSTWNGSICDREGARRAAGSALMGQLQFGVVAGNLSSVTAAQNAAATNSLTMSICDRGLLASVQRGYKVASNYSATFDSNYSDLYDSLPSSATHQRGMFMG